MTNTTKICVFGATGLIGSRLLKLLTSHICLSKINLLLFTQFPARIQLQSNNITYNFHTTLCEDLDFTLSCSDPSIHSLHKIQTILSSYTHIIYCMPHISSLNFILQLPQTLFTTDLNALSSAFSHSPSSPYTSPLITSTHSHIIPLPLTHFIQLLTTANLHIKTCHLSVNHSFSIFGRNGLKALDKHQENIELIQDQYNLHHMHFDHNLIPLTFISTLLQQQILQLFYSPHSTTTPYSPPHYTPSPHSSHSIPTPHSSHSIITPPTPPLTTTPYSPHSTSTSHSPHSITTPTTPTTPPSPPLTITPPPHSTLPPPPHHLSIHSTLCPAAIGETASIHLELHHPITLEQLHRTLTHTQIKLIPNNQSILTIRDSLGRTQYFITNLHLSQSHLSFTIHYDNITLTAHNLLFHLTPLPSQHNSVT